MLSWCCDAEAWLGTHEDGENVFGICGACKEHADFYDEEEEEENENN